MAKIKYLGQTFTYAYDTKDFKYVRKHISEIEAVLVGLMSKPGWKDNWEFQKLTFSHIATGGPTVKQGGTMLYLQYVATGTAQELANQRDMEGLAKLMGATRTNHERHASKLFEKALKAAGIEFVEAEALSWGKPNQLTFGLWIDAPWSYAYESGLPPRLPDFASFVD